MLNEAAKEGAAKVLALGLEVGFKDDVQQGIKR